MKILLMCGAGASSGFMAQSMRKAASAQGLDIEIIARSDAELKNNIAGANLVMVGPHLEYNQEAISKSLEGTGVPFIFIDKEAYGALDGAAALKQALDFIGSNEVVQANTSVPAESSVATKKKGQKAPENAEDPADQKGVVGWVNRALAPTLNKICANDYVAAIQESIMSVLPMIMVGSVASMVSVFRNFEILAWLPDISLLNTFSFGLVGLFLSFMLPMKIMEKKDNLKLKNSACLTGIALFLVVCVPTIDGDAGTMALMTNKIGASGMLVAVVTGIFTAVVFGFASRHSLFKKDTIMPDIVVNWVDSLIPVAVCILVGLAFYWNGFDVSLVIQSLFEPIQAIGQTLPGMILCSFLTMFLYSFGFTWILSPIVMTIWYAGIDANALAVAAGGVATNMNLMETFHGLQYIGGQGATLTLCLLLMCSRSRRLKAIGRVTIVPSIFNVNEPIVFGAPVVWNPILMIPMWIISIVLPIVTWLALTIGFCPVPSAPFQLWFLPIYIQAYFATGSVMGVVLCLINTAISLLIWLPFFKVYESQEYAKELAEEEAKGLI